MKQPPPFSAKAQEVWPYPGHPGFRRSMESAGTVAAPLLAGFSFTLLVLVLPTLGTDETVVTAPGGISVAHHSVPFSAAPDLAALLFLIAGLLMIFSIQAAIFMRYYGHTPGELEEFYPQYFRDGQDEHPEQVDVPDDLPDWNTAEKPAIRVGKRWYGGLMRSYLHDELWRANRSGRWTRRLYHFGILALLAGLAALVWPPEHQDHGIRLALAVVAVAGAACEGIWIIASSDLTKRIFGPPRPRQQSATANEKPIATETAAVTERAPAAGTPS